jgi:hypothetical protein
LPGPVEGAVGLVGSVAGQLGPVQRHGADPDHPRGGAQLERLHEEPGEGLLVADPEPRDGHMVGLWLAASTRKAMSSVQRRSICRDERTPMQ